MTKAKNGYFIPFSDGDGILISAPTPWCRCRLLVSGGPRRLTNCQARGAETAARMGLVRNGRNFYPPRSFPFDGFDDEKLRVAAPGVRPYQQHVCLRKSFHVNAINLPIPDILGFVGGSVWGKGTRVVTQDDAGGDSGTSDGAGDIFTKGPLAINCNIRRS
ncbi:predicted protein [Chaetomium globosum CBS 148.51]|uniref:Uncharacterized protein n=1 Tax=Chaetomium globosum (strain ATCC 6205 / CBS 148.51 / DSM 1962 / NBRC 6347 / NRRL 1970) TaxID=306901 RepID=Q2H2U1_CHAGB|nr:uncharacterized protein CHGG_03905 [Chaetomium globosum CBS 148.51]EAQ87286.1 predicted protein [Chaetomium globosum CBS 148.51]